MRRTIAVLAALGLMLVLGAPQALAANGPKDKPPKKDNDTYVQLLAINDFHGHLDIDTPGTIQTGCCVANSANNAWTPMTVPAGGVEYLATHIKQLREQNSNTIAVGAGDLIGASPLISGLFHDEPAILAMNALQLDVSGVGNHEFDEGINELLRMQNGGCAGADTCQLEPFPGAAFQYLAANVFYQGTDTTILPPYEIEKIDNAKIAFIGLTLEGTPTIVTPSGVAGLEFRPEVQTINALVHKLRNEQGVRAFVVLIHQGGFQNPPSPGPFPDPPNPNGYTDVNRCVSFSGPEITAIAKGLDPQVDIIVSAHTHAPYICPNFAGTGKYLTSASSFGRVITDIDLVIDHQSKDVKSVTAKNVIVTRDVDRDPDEKAIVDRYREASAPIANQIVGSVTADITRAATPAGESALGDVIADAQLKATAATDFGSSVIAFMNPGGIRQEIFYANSPGGEAAGQVTYGELFTVQPFGNSLVVKTCTGAQIDALLEQQIFPTGTSSRILQVSNGFTYSWSASAPQGSRIDPSSIKLNGVTLDPATGYRVTMNSFLATGGDGFTVFNQCTNALGGEIDLDALVRFFMQFGDGNPPPEPVPPGPQNRITRLP
ncbi:MAG TPA: bifunctional metallophosphatase/5'-nucleotidase [Gaiella sp.]|jgi:5'-nucleotidase